MNNSVEVIGNQLTGKQLINAILKLKSENRLYRCLNKLKDDLIRKKIEFAEEVKNNILSAELTFQSNERLISEQKICIDELTRQIDYLNNQLSMSKSSVEDNSKILDSRQDTIQSLSRKLREAEKYIDDQNYAIDKLKKKLSDSKDDFESLKKALKERCLERLEKANCEIEEEREKMSKKLKEVREFYDAEGKDHEKQIRQLKEQLDLLRNADFSRPDQSTSRGKGRKRATSTKRGTGGRGRGRPTATKKTRVAEVDSSVNFDDVFDFEFPPKKTTEEADCSMAPDSQNNQNLNRSQSLSPIEWRTPRTFKNQHIDGDDD